MSSTVKSFKVTYNPVNEENTFTSGDCLSGQVTLEVAKECHIKSLLIQLKGKARVLWTETYGQVTVPYYAKDKYFSIKHYFIADKDFKGDTTVAAGLAKNTKGPIDSQCLVCQNMPSSFNGSAGKIVYSLKARLSRSMRIDKKDSTKINFVTRADLCCDPELTTPQHECKDKGMKMFSSGTVAMDVDIEKTGYFQGEGIKVLACIENNSSREIRPKYCVYRKHSFFASGRRRLHTKDLLKEVGEPIAPSDSVKVSRIITIPHDMEPSILNCSILKAEYRVRVRINVTWGLIYKSQPRFHPEIHPSINVNAK
uniref:Arrestin C-terminal-like domain-containing protein n=1 Tax=Dicentrarchus labrax TaxID=13489 RepID=A0A8C4IRG2_DICLA